MSEVHTGQPWTKSNLGKKFTEEHKAKIAVSNMGNKGRTGMPHTEGTKEKMAATQKGKKLLPEHIEHIKTAIAQSEKSKIASLENLKKATSQRWIKPDARLVQAEKMRISYQKRMESIHGQLVPFYNPQACEVFNDINQTLGWSGQHAENGGEYKVRGWFLDYYEPSRNVAIEYDESHHQRPKQRRKDLLKEAEVTEVLNCQFIHITEGDEWRLHPFFVSESIAASGVNEDDV